MSMKMYLELGRVSNLPTVLTNVTAGAALAGALRADLRLALVMAAMVLFYVAGMYLNDAFDRHIDARERPERPIPSGRISAAAVFTAGFVMMALGAALLAVAGLVLEGGTGWLAPASSLALAGAIVLYDAWHKDNPLSPFLMGLCRVFVYVTAAYAVSRTLGWEVLGGAAVALCYLIGLTYVAKQENLVSFSGGWPLVFLAAPFLYAGPQLTSSPTGLAILVGFAAWVLYALSLLLRPAPGHVPKAVVSLIAGICLLDALLVVLAGHPMLAWGCVGAFVLTLLGQRLVSGT